MSDTTIAGNALPVGSAAKRAFGWAGMLMLLLTEGSLFAYLLFGYYYFYVQQGRTFLPNTLPGFLLSGPNTAILILSSVAVWWGERGIIRGSRGQTLLGIGMGIVLGAGFMAIQVFEWLSKDFTIASNSYGSLYFTITGFHMVHVLAGLVMLAVVFLWSSLGLFDRERHVPVSIAAVYWHFVDAVWLAVFFTIYVTPRLG